MEHLSAVFAAPPVPTRVSMRRDRHKAGRVLLLLAALAFGLVFGLVSFLRSAAAAPSTEYLASANAVMRQALLTIDDYIERQGRIPDSLAEAGFTLPDYTPIARVEIQAESGIILVQLKAPDAALALVYARVAGDDDQPEWVCSGGPEVDVALLPAGCGLPSDASDTDAEQ